MWTTVAVAFLLAGWEENCVFAGGWGEGNSSGLRKMYFVCRTFRCDGGEKLNF